MPNLSERRILALDIRPRSFGFVVFEGAERLLDWGARTFGKGANVVRVPPKEKFASMLAEYSPETVVVSQRVLRKRLKKSSLAAIALAVARKRRVPVRAVARGSVKRAFTGQNGNKDKVARALARRFPELAPMLPPKRKCWQSEDYRMSIFDAAALGVAYFNRGKPVEPQALPPDPSHPS